MRQKISMFSHLPLAIQMEILLDLEVVQPEDLEQPPHVMVPAALMRVLRRGAARQFITALDDTLQKDAFRN